MKMLRSTFALTMSVLSIGLAAHGQNSRSWVSGVGDDANPCSRTAPCKTFAGALSKTGTGGEIDALDPGGFGPVTITKSITLDGGGGQNATVLGSGSDGIDINGAGAVVTLRNLSINGIVYNVPVNPGAGGLTGVNFLVGSALHIEHCVILGFTQNGININPSTGAQVFIDDTTSQDNTGNGLNVVGGLSGTPGEVHVSVSNSHFSNNAVGIYAGDNSRVTVRSSDASGNTGAGFQVFASANPSNIGLVDSLAANNLGAGAQAGGGAAAATIRASNLTLYTNNGGFLTGTNGSIISFGNNANAGNGAPTSKVALQ
jgi:hypothetical protein